MSQPAPFALVASRDDTALYKDARIGFSHLVPGRPTFAARTARPGDPPADAVLHLQDAPITLRYRVEAPVDATADSDLLARTVAERHGSWRAQTAVTADVANASWLAAWGATAAFVAAYDVPPNTMTGTGHAREDLFVLVRHGLVLLVSWTYPRAFVDDPAYAAFASVAEATMVWDAARWDQRGRVWPASELLGPGLHGALGTKHAASAKELASAVLLPDERARIFAMLSAIVSGAGAPWVPLSAEVRESNRRALLAAIRNERIRAFVDGAFSDVRTAHDLRGLALLLARSVEGGRTPTLVSARAPSGLATHAR